MAKIEIVKINRKDYGGTKGFVEISVDGIIIRDCSVKTGKDGGLWLAMPARKFTGNDGVDKWVKTVELPKDIHAEAQKLVLAQF